MAANLSTMADGRVAMAAWGRIPVWHHSGQRSNELMTVEHACDLTGVDYQVIARPSHFKIDGEFKAGKGVQVVRADNWTPLGYASERYKVIQNRQAFDVVGSLIGDGIAGVMTAGVLGLGERAWMQFVLGEIGVDKLDRGVATVLVVNDHAGRMAATFAFTTVWVVCANTEAAARREYERTGKFCDVAHTGDTTFNLDVVRASINLADKVFRDWNETARMLSKVRLNSARDAYRLALAALAPDETTIEGWEQSSAGAKASKTRWSNLVAGIMREYFTGPGQDIDTRKSTAWGAYNAVTGWVDFGRSGPKKDVSKQVESMWFGSGAAIKDRARDAAIDHFLGGKEWSEHVVDAERALATV